MSTKRKSAPKTVIMLSGRGGELDRFELAGVDLPESKIAMALSKLVLHTWSLAPGDTISITEEGETLGDVIGSGLGKLLNR